MLRIVGELLVLTQSRSWTCERSGPATPAGYASILDQAYSLKLELARKLPSLHVRGRYAGRGLANSGQPRADGVVGSAMACTAGGPGAARWRQRLWAAAICAGLAALLLSPWLVRSYSLTGSATLSFSGLAITQIL